MLHWTTFATGLPRLVMTNSLCVCSILSGNLKQLALNSTNVIFLTNQFCNEIPVFLKGKNKNKVKGQKGKRYKEQKVKASPGIRSKV